ncbi:MAG: cysteine--tRNA ligase [Cyanobacteria bacterium NC_groundwater_1444_Ag_S-0.65um_54_12]|nr:cysteine--tRNA ligase [Cyanobacteria bacterium NC_groundwater_1444_Ag_S-0.65um_54_12]
MLRIYNDLTKRLERFAPLAYPRVSFYVCGVTVYDYCHLGHARCYIVWDIVRRYLAYRGYQVVHVQNFTDIDDKIIRRAAELGEDPGSLAQRYEAEYFADMDRLNVGRADYYPRATEHIYEMIDFVEKLLEQKHAYLTSQGTVYFKVRSYPRYGQLSGRELADLSQRTRLEDPDPYKEDPADFALWKAAKEGEPAWNSPWGSGRPGWHLECSVMASKHLGETVDIHAGGRDLIFPHHENEIAQSESLTEQLFVKYWLHNGFVKVEAEKMAKSLGNFRTIRQLLEHYDPQQVRYFLLQTHYRQDCDFSDQSLDSAGNALDRLRRSLAEQAESLAPATDPIIQYRAALEQAFQAAMDDDFNTPRALAALWEARAHLRALPDQDRAAAGHIVERVRELGAVLGIDLGPLPRQTEQAIRAIAWLTEPLRQLASNFAIAKTAQEEPHELLDSLILRRQQAKKERNFALADEIRSELRKLGIALADRPGGQTSWELATDGVC